MEGDFTPWEAEQVLIAFFDQKINLHKLRNLAFHEGNSAPGAHAVKRIEELTASKQQLTAAIREAKAAGLNLKIQSKITIETV